MKTITFSILLLFSQATAVAQQNFSCGYGARGACLGFNDKIVNSNSMCFSEFTCDFRGFICKSKLDDVVDEYDTLVRKHNELIRSHRELADTAQELVDRRKSLGDELNAMVTKFRALTNEYESRGSELISANQRIAQLESIIRLSQLKSEQVPQRKK